MESEKPAPSPSDATVVQTLRDGYWDRTEVIRLRDGSLRVRKVSKGAQAGPWGQVVLRREMQYLLALTGPVAEYFPRVLAAWDTGTAIGYEMSYVDHTRDAGAIAQNSQVDQAGANRFQEALGEVVFGLIHVATGTGTSLAAHIRQALQYGLTALQEEPLLGDLIQAGAITVNGRHMLGTRHAIEAACRRGGPLAMLDAGPTVRLHGDCFLENILVPEAAFSAEWPARLTLVDPVSVAGVYEGHPLFDLVKYESYATGELLALRSGLVEISGFERPGAADYVYRVREDEPALRPFGQVDWRSRFRSIYLRRYPPVDPGAYHLLEGYFALVMAVCTSGLQRRARLLRATMAFNSTTDGP